MSGISIGTKILASDGFRNLEAGSTHYFLRSSPVTGQVLLLQFAIRESKLVEYNSETRPKRLVAPPPFPSLARMPRPAFEEGIVSGTLAVIERSADLPPWVAPLVGLDLDIVDSLRRSPKKLHVDRVDEKLEVIFPLVERFAEILDAEDPDREINRYTRSLPKALNETRVRLWFFSYLAFGRQRAALHYPIHRIGTWDRASNTSAVKRGRPSRKGKGFGYNSDGSMIEKMIKGYRRECGLGVTMSEIYREVMRKDFGCRSREIVVGSRVCQQLYHPSGEPFPMKRAFVYRILSSFGIRAVQETLLGKVRIRSRLAAFRGSFTERSWNLMQRVETDAAASAELPKGYVEGHTLKPLYVVSRRDTASGAKTGIGFSQGSETAAAYRMAKFCEAIDKVRFCGLFGISIRPKQWPMKGSSPADIQDRGPGATKGAQSHLPEYRPVVSELAPSYAGQSKAIVETSHPKSRSNDEAPSFVQSDFRSVELARRAIFDLLRFNETCNVGDRIPPDLDGMVSRPTPNGLWEALDGLGRNDAIEIPFEEAVRAYLDRVSASLTREGVILAGRRYSSENSGFGEVLNSLAGNQKVEISVYILEACIRHIWLDWKGRLIELQVRYPAPVGTVVEYMSLSEAVQYAEHCDARDLDHEDHREAAEVSIREQFEDQTGQNWNSSRRVAGRPKRGSPAARNEEGEARSATKGKRAA